MEWEIGIRLERIQQDLDDMKEALSMIVDHISKKQKKVQTDDERIAEVARSMEPVVPKPPRETDL